MRFKLYIFIFLFYSICEVNAQIDSTLIDDIPIDTTEYISGDIDFNLLVASYKGYGKEVIHLLEKGANINTRSEEGVTPLMYAASNGHPETVKILILNGANINSKPLDGTSAIISASIPGYYEIIEELIIADANVNDKDNYGATPLLYSSAYNHYQLCDMLLYYKANPDLSDYQLTSPLMAAVYAGNISIAEILLNEGANINKEDINGYTALMIAAQESDTAFVRYLVNKGANMNSRNENGYSAFYSAAYNGSVSVMDMLWKSGLSERKEEMSEPNPYHANQLNNRKEVKAWLKEHDFESKFSPGLSTIYIGGDLAFSADDFFMGFRAGVLERNTNISAEFDYSFRPAQKRILWKDSDQEYYQFWEKRNMMSITLSNIHTFFKIKTSFLIGGYLAVSGTYSFGPEYRGTEIKAESFFKVSPIAGFYGESKNLYFRLNYEYLNTGLLEASPHRINFGVYYKISIGKKAYFNKEIKWF